MLRLENNMVKSCVEKLWLFIVRITVILSGTSAKLLVLILEVQIVTTKLSKIKASDHTDGGRFLVVIQNFISL